MGKNLAASNVDRQNILNNPFALQEIQKATHLKGLEYKGQFYLSKEQVADFYEVDIRTIERHIEKNSQELRNSGYTVLRGSSLQKLKLFLKDQDATDINVGSKVTQLGLFNFKAFINIGMLLSESEPARILRQTILDIVIDTINQRTGGGTKYVNQRDEDFIFSYFEEEHYRKEFVDALKNYVSMGIFKYPLYTDKIYVSIFRENSVEYRKILNLHSTDTVRDTFYAEVLDLVASYEYGFAKVLEEAFNKKGKLLDSTEVNSLFRAFEKQPLWKPLVERARQKMASRDLAFRDALHIKLEKYIIPVKTDEFERFLGEKSKELVDRLNETKEVFKRLKERG